MKKHRHTVWQGEWEDKGPDVLRQALISFVNMTGFFPRSVLNKYAVIYLKRCLGSRRMSLLLKTARSQARIYSVACKVKTWLSCFWDSPLVSSPIFGSISPLSLSASQFYQKLHDNLQGLVSLAPGHALPLTVAISEGEILPLRSAAQKYILRIYSDKGLNILATQRAPN